MNAALMASLIFAVSCATSDTRFGSNDPIGDYKNSKADGAAYAAEAMHLRSPQKIRPANDFEFFYKHCLLNDDRTYYSKTSYWCSEAY